MVAVAQRSAVASFLAALRQDAPGVRISDSAIDRFGYARDASAEAFLERREGVLPSGPGAIVWPGSVEDVIAIVRLAGEHGVPLAAYGAGSGVVHGLNVDTAGVVVDLKRLDDIAIDAGRRTVSVGPGVIGERFERALNAAGFSAGHFPSSIYCSTVGGWVAARSAGQMSSRYGKIEDMVLALEAVDGAGRLIRARRGDAPDLLRAIIGSEGTLAVITCIELRIHPLPSHRTLMGLAAPDVETGLSLMRSVLQAGLRPAVFRMYDPPDTMLAGGIPTKSEDPSVVLGCIGRGGNEDPFMRGDPRMVTTGPGLFDLMQSRATAAWRKSLWAGGGNAAIRKLVGGALKRTSWLQLPYEALPTSCLLVLGLEGSENEVRDALDASLDLARRGNITLVGKAPGERWLRRRHAVTYKMPPFLRAGGWADTMEVSAPWSVLPSLYHDARTAMLEHSVTLAHFSHAYSEGASIYFTVAGGGSGLEAQREAHRACVDAAMVAFARHGAALSHHHGVGRMKVRHLYDVLGPGARPALSQLKRAMDPHGVLNPGALGLGGAR